MPASARSALPSLMLLVAGSAAAADNPADQDMVLLRGGDAIRCTVMHEEKDRIVVHLDGVALTLYRHRILDIQRGAGRRSSLLDLVSSKALPPAPLLRQRPDDARGSDWELDVLAAAGGGMHFGSVDSTGVLDQSGTLTPLALQFDTGGPDHLPSGQIRLGLSPARTGPRPVVGMQVSVAHPAGSGLGMRLLGLEALGGLRWGDDDGATWELLGGIAYLTASCQRDIELLSTSGALLGAADARSDLDGVGLRAEAAVRWQDGGLRRGFAIGLTGSALSGSGSWTSSNGVYAGREDLEATLIGVYATLQLDWTL